MRIFLILLPALAPPAAWRTCAFATAGRSSAICEPGFPDGTLSSSN